MLAWFLLLILVILLIGAIPAWPHSRGWGNYPAGIILLVLLCFMLLWVLGWLPYWGHHAWWGGHQEMHEYMHPSTTR